MYLACIKQLRIMGLQIDRDTIIAFLLNTLPLEQMSLVADEILADGYLAKIYEEEKIKVETHQYVDNELSPSQRVEFEHTLKKRLELSKEIYLQREVNNSIENLILKEKLEEAYRNYISAKEQRNTIRTFSISRKLKYWLVAASIAVLILGGGIAYYFQPNDSLENSLYAKYYAPYDYSGYMVNSSSFSIAKQKYMDGEYTNALLLLKDLPSSVTIEVERNLFIGLALMEVGKYSVAADYLEQVLNNQSKLDYFPQARWYLGLCFLKIGDKEKAINTFRAIVDSNDYNYKKAKRILNKLCD